MLLERSYIEARAGAEDDFAGTMAKRAAPLLESVPGVRSVRWGRGVERPGTFMLLVEWEDMAAHEAFKSTPAMGNLRQLLGAHSTGGAMEHFEMQ